MNNEEDRKAIEDAFMKVTERQVHVEFRKKSSGSNRQQELVRMDIFEEKNIPVEYDDN